MRKIKERCLSRKDYLKKDNSNVGYALYIQDNIKKDDYVRLNTGEIVKAIGVKENNVNKKAIYYGFYDTDWFDSSAVENFSEDIIDLIEEGDYVNGEKIITITNDRHLLLDRNVYLFDKYREIKTILTKELYGANCYKVVGGEDEL